MTGLTNIKTNLDLNSINTSAKTNKLFNIIKFSEKRYKDEIDVIANNVVYGNKRFVLLAGPSSSGKTTTSRMISEQLKKLGKSSITISLDDFFINRENTPKLPDGNYDFENFSIVDLDTFNNCIEDLINKYETFLPQFDFINGRRKDELKHIKITDENVIIIEGIHALNPKLLRMETTLFYKVYVCVYSNFAIDGKTIIPAKLLRFMRRLIRDVQERGTSIEQTIDTWNNVCAGEELYIKPYRSQANYLFDTTHMYEPLLYHTYLKPLLAKCLDKPYAKELYEKLEYCGFLTQDIVPDDSLLWEFLVKGFEIEKLY